MLALFLTLNYLLRKQELHSYKKGIKDDRMSLFRKQVIQQQYDSLWGSVVLSQPPSYRVLSIGFVTLVFTVSIFLFTADYRQKEQVKGVILPNKGVVELRSPATLLIEHRFVEPGQNVKKGQALFQLSAPTHIGSGENEKHITIDELNKQVNLLQQQLNNADVLFQKRQSHLKQKVQDHLEQQTILKQQLNLAITQQKLSKDQIDAISPIAKQGHTSQNHLLQLQQTQHQLHQAVLASKRQIQQTQLSINQANSELWQLPVKHKQQQQQMQLALSDKKMSLSRAQAASSIVIHSPISGRITAMEVYQDQWLKPQQYIAAILPESPTFHAEIYVPSKAFGFIEQGQQTRIKLNAFPYQKFGYLTGVISNKSSHAMSNHQANTHASDNLYKVTVQLDKQSVLAYGKDLPLQSGMGLIADILIDKRSLVEWLLAPLYSLKG